MRRFVLVPLLTAAVLAGCQTAAPVTDASLPGSTRGARVAIPAADAARGLTFLSGPMPEEARARLGELPAYLRIVEDLTPEEVVARAGEFDGADARFCSPEFMNAASRLRWAQSPSAGVDHYLRTPELRMRDDVVLTNMQGVHGPTIADHVFAMLLSLTRDMAYYVQTEQRGTWNRDGSGRERIALRDRTLLVVGLGGIGREVAQRGKGFGMRVLATRRSATPPPPYVDEQGGTDALSEMLPRADVVVLCVPLTEETTHLIDADALAAMKPGSYLINIARGRVVDTDALLEALDAGRLAGAGLDVTEPEPLPPDHPLWTRPNVIITPHVAARSALTREQWIDLYVENLRRFANGEPLLNVVDKAAGY